jgi:hypothetical protein
MYVLDMRSHNHLKYTQFNVKNNPAVEKRTRKYRPRYSARRAAVGCTASIGGERLDAHGIRLLDGTRRGAVEHMPATWNIYGRNYDSHRLKDHLFTCL